MAAIKGPAVYLAQFLRDTPPYNTLENITVWFAQMGYTGVQIPAWEGSMMDLDTAANSKQYCSEIQDLLQNKGLEVTELAAHLPGQVMGIHPAYEIAFQSFYPEGLEDAGRVAYAVDQIKKTIIASANMGLKVVPTLSGALAWHMIYPWPQRPEGLVDTAFKELARRWKPVLDCARDHGVTIAYELHPGSDLFDGATFEKFLDVTDNHPAVCINYDPSHFLLQQLDYCEFIRLYGERITGFHVKDAEFLPTGRVGVYGGYQGWKNRAGRFRSLGDGQVDFKRIFSLLTEVGYTGWAVLEWECCIKSPEQGAREAASFIKDHIIEPTDVAFDDFAGGSSNDELNRKILGMH